MRKRIGSAIASMFGLMAVMLGGISYLATPAGAIADNGKVLTIVLENHGYNQVWNGVPTLKNYALVNAYFTNYHGITHPSEPNYLSIAGGSTFGDTSDHNPAYQVSGQSIFGQAISATSGSFQGSARSYQEGMVDNCDQTDGGTGTVRYVVKHNPWASFTDERSVCNLADQSSGSTTSGHLHDDVVNGTLPNVGLFVPDNCHNGHSPCGLSDEETFLSTWLPFLTSGPDFDSGKLAIVVTFDEDENDSEGNHVLTVVISKDSHIQGKGAVTTSGINHYSLSGFMSDTTGSAHLRNAATAPDMRAALGLPAPK